MTRKDGRSFGFVRVGAAVPRLEVAEPYFNADQIITLMEQAEAEGVRVLTFPELSITGYTCKDLFHQSALREHALGALELIRVASSQLFSGLLFVGIPIEADDQLFNCAVAIQGGRMLGIVPKSFIPNYKEFEERRWFSSAAGRRSKELRINGDTVPFGTDLLFVAHDVPGLTVGAEICEDLWVPIPPSCFQALSGATVLVNLSASNDLIGKAAWRSDLVGGQSGRCIAAYVYTSCGVGESTTDVVFGGHMLIGENGSIVRESKRLLGRENQLMTADIDLDRLRIDRIRTNSFGDWQQSLGLSREFRRIEFQGGRALAPSRLHRVVEAHPFVPRHTAQLNDRCEEIFGIQVSGLVKRLEHLWKIPCGCAATRRSGKPVRCQCPTKIRRDQQVVIGVSGGLDSTHALNVTCRAMDELGLPHSNILAITMPGFGTTKKTKGNAHKLMKLLGVTAKEVDIRAMCLEEMRAMGHKPFGIDLKGMTVRKLQKALEELPEDANDLVFENVQARMRTSILMNSGFVIGTGDLSELALGWCTYNGDHMSMYNVNCTIPKTLVQFLVRWTAQTLHAGETQKVLIDIVNTAISPELLPTGKDGEIRQKTEDKVGPYELHDFFLYHMLRFAMAPEKILYLATMAQFNKPYTAEEIGKWLRLFITRFFAAQFKRSCVPDGPKVGTVSLSPRGDWRMPSDAQANIWLTWVEEHLPPATAGGASETGADASGSHANHGDESATTGALATAKGSTQMTTANNGGGTNGAKPKKVFRVLLRIDLLNDFMPTGSLPVTEGDLTVAVANSVSRSGYYDEVIDIQDSHPEGHGSFASQHAGKNPFDKTVLNGVEQVLWPDHCIVDTNGWHFHADLDRSMVKRTFRKGEDKRVDSYSGFYDNGRHAATEFKKQHPFLGQSTGLAEYINQRAAEEGADEVQIDGLGLALHYCVTFTLVDGKGESFNGTPYRVRCIADGCRAIGDYEAALEQLRGLGIEVIRSSDVLAQAETVKA